MVTIFFTIFNIFFDLICNFINPYFHYNKFENKNLVNSFNKLPNIVFNEWKKYKFINRVNPTNINTDSNIHIENNINKYLEIDKDSKNTENYLHMDLKLNEHIEELDEKLVKKYCINILSYSKLNNMKHMYIFTDGSSIKKGIENNGGSSVVTINPKTNKIDCYGLKCTNCDSLSSEYNPFIFLINHWFEIVPNDMNRVVIFCDNKGVVDNLNHIFDILHHNLLHNINTCSKYSFKNMHEKWCRIFILSFNRYSINEKHIIISKLQLFWIKAHVMFLWNILADVVSKWSRLHL